MRFSQAVLRSLIQQNVVLLIGFATGIAIARLVTPREFAAYSLALAVLNVGVALKDFGVNSYVISSKELHADLLGSAYGLGLASAGTIALFCFVASWPLAALYGDPVLGDILRLSSMAAIFQASTLPATVRLTRGMHFDTLLVIGVGAALTQSAVALILAWMHWGALALGWGFLAGSIATSLLTYFCAPSQSRVAPSFRRWGQLLGFGGWMSASVMVGTISVFTPQLLIGRFISLSDAALFARAQNIVSVILNGFFYAIMRPMLPKLSEAEHTEGNLTRLYLRVVESVTGIAWPAYAILLVWSEPLVGAIYGEPWREAGALMLPLVLAHAMSLSVAPHYDVLIIRRKVRLLFASEASIFLLALLLFVCGLRVGLEAAMFTLAISGAIFAVWYFFVLKSVLHFAPIDLLRVWARSIALTIVVIPFPLLLHNLLPTSNFAILTGATASAALSGLVWLVALRLLGHELDQHVAAFLTKLPLNAASPLSNAGRTLRAKTAGKSADDR